MEAYEAKIFWLLNAASAHTSLRHRLNWIQEPRSSKMLLKAAVLAICLLGASSWPSSEDTNEEDDFVHEHQLSQLSTEIEELRCSVNSRLIEIENDIASLKKGFGISTAANASLEECVNDIQELCRKASQGGTFCPATQKCYSGVQVVKVEYQKALHTFCARFPGGSLAYPKDEEEMQHIIDCLNLPNGEEFHIGKNPLADSYSYDSCDLLAVDPNGILNVYVSSGDCNNFEKFFCEVPLDLIDGPEVNKVL